MTRDYASAYGYNPEEWPDDWWITPGSVEEARALSIHPFIFSERHLKAHLAEPYARYVAESLFRLCHALPQSVASVFLILDTTFLMCLEDFYTIPPPISPVDSLIEAACILSSVSRLLGRRIHLFNESMSPLYIQIVDIGLCDPSNPSFLRLIHCLSNRCSALNRFLLLVETLATYTRSLALFNRAFVATWQQQPHADDIAEIMSDLSSDDEQDTVVATTEEEEDSEMEVEDEENSSIDDLRHGDNDNGNIDDDDDDDDDGDGPRHHDDTDDNGTSGEVGVGYGHNSNHGINDDYMCNVGDGDDDDDDDGDDFMHDIDIGDWGSGPDDDDDDDDDDD